MDSDNRFQGSDLLDKANALMRRHRVFVARPLDESDSAEPVSLAAEEFFDTAPAGPSPDDDIPVLTDVVATDVFSVIAPVDNVPVEPMVAASWANEQVQRWLDEELPTVVLSVLDGLADRLVAEVVTRAQVELLNAITAGPEPAQQDVVTDDAPLQ